MQQQGGPDAEVMIGIFAFYAVIIAVAILLQILFLLSMSRCLAQVSRRNRQMEPGQVWLCLIPLFGTVWLIIMIIRVADSLKDEYYDRGLREDGDFGKTLGIVYVVSAFCCGPIALVCYIMYWVKIAGYTRTLASDPGDYGDYDEYEEDDYDDRPPRRRRRRDRDDDEDDDRRPWDRGR